MNETEKPSVVVTGASTGIGYACVEALLASGHFVFGAVRKKDDARRLKSDFGDDFAPLLFDVTDDAAVKRAAALVEERLAGRALAGLVNNAGVAFPGPLLYQPIEEFHHQFEINVYGTAPGHPGLRAAARRWRNSAGAAGAHRQYELRRRDDGVALRWSLRRVETCAGGDVRRVAPRADALWRRRHRHRAGRHQDADLG